MRTPSNNASSKSHALVEKVLNKMEGLKKPRKYFMISVIVLFLSMRGRYTFKGMQRYGSNCEKTYRLQFEQDFDFLEFNMELCKSELSDQLVLAFDPSYLPKSGKHTPHRGNFWSGCLGKAVKGIEIGGLGVVDLKHNTAFSLESIQTPNPESLKAKGKSLVDHYAQLIVDRWEKLKTLSIYLAVDGYFAKKGFIDPVLESTDLEIISKLRSDANLMYLYNGSKKQGRGRPKKYDGKVNLKKIDKRRLKKVYQGEDVIIYETILWSVFLKRVVKVAYVEFLTDGQLAGRYAVFFSTDLNLEARKIYQYYKARFQIEFLFRDAKQYTGLTHCQARSEQKIYFHTNTALTAIGVAKIAHYINEQDIENSENEIQTSFSIADVKTSYFNELMLNLFLSNFEIDTELPKNKKAIKRILEFGKIAA